MAGLVPLLLSIAINRADAWATRTHQQITEAAWALIKARAQGASFFADHGSSYPTQADCQRTVEFFQNIKAYSCRPGSGRDCPMGYQSTQYEFVYWPAVRLSEYSIGLNGHYNVFEPSGARIDGGNSQGYVPYSGILATGAIPTVTPPGGDPKTDYTGSVLGFYAGYGDYLSDTYAEVRNDALLARANGTASAFEVLGALLACEGCVLSGLSCGACAAILGGVIGVEELFVNKLRDIPSGPTNSILTHVLTAFWHFQNTYPYNPNGSSLFDDVDGFDQQRQKARDWLKDYIMTWGSWYLHIAIRPDYSAAPVSSYQITSGDDGQRFSDPARQPASWWSSSNISETTFMPADNMARAQWENWLKMRRSRAAGGTSAGQPYDLTYLGAALHAMQDATAYHHGTGTLIAGHESYENHVEVYFDAEAMKRHASETSNASHVIMRWAGSAGTAAAQEIAIFLDGTLKPFIDWARPLGSHVATRNDLPIRMLSQRLLELTQEKHAMLMLDKNIEAPTEDPPAMAKTLHGRVAMPRAIAATIALLVEASNPAIDTANVGNTTLPMAHQVRQWGSESFTELDTDGDGVADSLDWCNHSNASGTGQVDANGCPVQSEQVGQQRSELRSAFKTCVEGVMPPLQAFTSGAVSAEDLITDGFYAKAACEAIELGAENGSVDDRFMVYRLSWTLAKNFAATRDRLAFDKEAACIRSQYPEVFPRANPTADTALCRCQVDSDGDRVSDCDDECANTPPRTRVDQRGCAR